MELVRYSSAHARASQVPRSNSQPPFPSELIEPVRNAIVRARHQLFAEQQSDGTWLGRQSTDATLPSQLIFLLVYLGREDCQLAQQCADAIIKQQGADDGWSAVPDGPADNNISVQAYFALKLAGIDPGGDCLRRARLKIRSLGGADATDHATRCFLALLGQISYDDCDPQPPEMILFGGQDSRRRIPMSISWSHRSIRAVEMERGVRELFVNKPCDWPATRKSLQQGWFRGRLFSLYRRVCQLGERWGWTPLRKIALGRAESQLLKQTRSGQLEELDFYELVWHIIALHTIGFSADSPQLRRCEATLIKMVDVDEETDIGLPRLRATPWSDSALVLRSLCTSGLPTAHSALGPAIQMLCRKAKNTVALTTIDLCNFLEGVRSAEMSQCRDESALPPDFDVCWDLEFSVDGTTQTARSPRKRIERAVARCIEQLRANQNTDGGWSAISSSNGSLRKSEPDVTGAVLEALKGHPREDAQSAMNRAACHLRSIQQADGSWADSTGAQDVLCTSAAVRGLLSTVVTPNDDAVAAAVNWLIVQQLPNGSWNFSASQTAWALDALAAAGRADEPAARCAIEFLLESQDDDGGWQDRNFVLYNANSNRWVWNELHSVAWPLLALSRWAVAASSAQSAVAHELSLRLISATAEI